MTGKTGIEHPFKVLEISITNDSKTIEDGYQAVVKKYKRYENSTDPRERMIYKSLFEAYKELKDPAKRKKIVDDYKQKLYKGIEVFISGKTIIEKTALEELIKMEVERWGFEPGLARKEIEYALKQKGIEIGKEIVKEPQLVSNAAIGSDQKSITITWGLPSSNCDEVLIIRRDDRPPSHANDGKEIFRGMTVQYRDNDISPGKCYYYAIFTLFEGRISKNPIYLQEYIVSPVSDTRVKNNFTEILIQWNRPRLAERTIIIRQAGKPPSIMSTRNALRISEGEKIYEGTETSYTDTGLMVETEYYYSLIAVFPGNRCSSEVVLSGKTLTLPGVPTALYIHEKMGSVVLQWTQAANAEGVRLIRKKHSPPTSENDGDIVCEGSLQECEDTKVEDGFPYFYALYSYRGNCFSEKGAVGKYFLKREPQNVNAAVLNASIKIQWNLPPGASGVMVRRSNTHPPANIHEGTYISTQNNQQLVDSGLSNNKAYHYTLFSIYTNRGKTEYSKGKQLSNLVPSGPPAPVRNIHLSHEEHAVRILWERPSRKDKNDSIGGIIIAFAKRSFQCPQGCQMNFSEIKNAIVGWAEYPLSFTDPHPPQGQIGYYAVFTAGSRGLNHGQSDIEVTFCGEKQIDLQCDVENLKSRRLPNGSIFITWDWPAGSEVVYIARSPTTPPFKIEHEDNRFVLKDKNGERINDGIVISILKRIYQMQKGYIDTGVDSPNLYYLVCTAAPSGRNIKFSRGKEIKIENRRLK